MTSSTATRWFKPDFEYDALTEDYAIVGQSASNVNAELARFDLVSPEAWRPKTFYDYAVEGYRWFTDYITDEGLFIYSDVDGKDPNHEQTIRDVMVKGPRLEKLEEHTEDAARLLLDFFVEPDKINDPDLKSKADNMLKTPPTIASVTDLVDHLTGRSALMDFVIKLKDSRAKVETLRIVSRQADREHPRPVMLLIGLLNDMKSRNKTPKRGWAIAYDFVENVIRIKSFETKEGEHPLADAWVEERSEDSFHQVRKPEDLAANLLLVVNPELSEEDKPYAKALAYVIGYWLQRHEEALGFSKEISVAMDDQMEAIKQDLLSIDFPDLPPESLKLNWVQEEITSIRYALQQNEDELRETALRSKKDGFETSADNLAKYFEKVLKDLDQIAENPEAPWEG